jgi:hypothetical protein
VKRSDGIEALLLLETNDSHVDHNIMMDLLIHDRIALANSSVSRVNKS